MSVEARLHRDSGSLTTLTDGRHAWTADVATALGGADAAPDPHALLDSALAACTALTLELYIRRKQLAVRSLRVFIDHEDAKTADGRKLYKLTRRLQVDGDLQEAERQRLVEIAGMCPIHKVLEGEVEIHTELMP